MGIDLCSENSSMSPRISFSHDLSLSDILPIEHRPFRSNSMGPNSSFDFDFVPLDQEPSSADEIFSDGKILPIQIKKKATGASSSAWKDHPMPDESRKQGGGSSGVINTEAEEKPSLGSGSGSKSFWRFKRSRSLNSGSGHGRSLSICPLPLLSRSNSTGSAAPYVKNSTFSKENSDSNSSSKKQSLKNANLSSPLKPSQASSSSSSTSFSGSYQKPPLRRGNGMKVNPVLNVPSGNLFGLSSVFFSGKDKASKRK
ncbi:uncharacterized protein LOC116202614 [Punica granatum]|uniref:Uncharacterized protein n=2 Tax=Punica granatum TaxID=22663 RepID=A0A218XIV6_PUNGR|nr:uncharacterized protein LOC116202614 [Punica granatum]OWM84656.1 hypothetical protein CDL15_Pgr027443 [Punica granatum]PKI69929.1 hypothetical protein CRG98_009804 [Punica granatum]